MAIITSNPRNLKCGLFYSVELDGETVIVCRLNIFQNKYLFIKGNEISNFEFEINPFYPKEEIIFMEYTRQMTSWMAEDFSRRVRTPELKELLAQIARRNQ